MDPDIYDRFLARRNGIESAIRNRSDLKPFLDAMWQSREQLPCDLHAELLDNEQTEELLRSAVEFDLPAYLSELVPDQKKNLDELANLAFQKSSTGALGVLLDHVDENQTTCPQYAALALCLRKRPGIIKYTRAFWVPGVTETSAEYFKRTWLILRHTAARDVTVTRDLVIKKDYAQSLGLLVLAKQDPDSVVIEPQTIQEALRRTSWRIALKRTGYVMSRDQTIALMIMKNAVPSQEDLESAAGAGCAEAIWFMLHAALSDKLDVMPMLRLENTVKRRAIKQTEQRIRDRLLGRWSLARQELRRRVADGDEDYDNWAWEVESRENWAVKALKRVYKETRGAEYEERSVTTSELMVLKYAADHPSFRNEEYIKWRLNRLSETFSTRFILTLYANPLLWFYVLRDFDLTVQD